MRILLATGALKHSLSAGAAADAVAAGLAASGLEHSSTPLPMADGGNGTVDAFCGHGRGERIQLQVHGPMGDGVQATYGLIDEGDTAVIEMAQASGLELIPEDRLDAPAACTFGTGELIRDALERGVRRLVIGLGGSATTDGGAGCLRALGARVLDAEGEPVPPGGGGLGQAQRVELAELDARLRDVEILVACDVDNPAVGERGAAAVYGPQKGADAQQVQELDRNLDHWFALLREAGCDDVRKLPGAGAAGAIAGGLVAATGGRIRPGFDLWCDLSDFAAHLDEHDLVITSEGRIDEQTVSGKGPAGVARMATERNLPCVVLVGAAGAAPGFLAEHGLPLVQPIAAGPMSLQDAIAGGEDLLRDAAERLGYLLQAFADQSRR